MSRIDFYRAGHVGCDDPTCTGNKMNVTEQELLELKDKFIDWNVAEDGTITSSGNESWIIEGKTFVAEPIVEDDDSLTMSERMFFSMRHFVNFTYKASIEPNWEKVPEQVKNHPDKDKWIEIAANQSYSYSDLAAFICCAEVSNVKVDTSTLTVSGYDHGNESVYTFTPVEAN